MQLIVLLLAFGSHAWGQSPGQRDFDVQTLSAYNQLDQSASGTSNGVNWLMCEMILTLLKRLTGW